MKLSLKSFYFLLLCISFISSKNQYYLSNPIYSDDKTLFSGILSFKGNFSASDYHYEWTKSSNLLIPIKKLNIQISLECNKYLHIYVTDALEKRWEHPFSISDSYKEKLKKCLKEEPKKKFK